ncbi:MAG: MBL fold metallo-hydrolase [Candidatus Methylomirabilia bacterium]
MHFAFLGTSAAVPSLSRDTTSVVFVGEHETILVDCGGSPVRKLLKAGVDPVGLTHVFISHIHPDHAYGLPALIQNLILQGRSAPLWLFCRGEHVEPLTELLRIFRLWDRPGAFPLTIKGVPPKEGVEVMRSSSFVVTASPNAHGAMPNLAIRVEVPQRGTAIVYSSDTEPCETVAQLASGAHTLIHEATFLARDRERFAAHSTAAGAGQIAANAGVRRLILTHIEADYHGEVDALLEEARGQFAGDVEIAEEFRPYPI